MANSFQPPSRIFYRLRRVLMRELGLARDTVRPHIALESLIPRDKRRLVWRALRREGLAYVEVTTDPDNLPSQKVIAANGGVLVERFKADAAYGDRDELRWRIALESIPFG